MKLILSEAMRTEIAVDKNSFDGDDENTTVSEFLFEISVLKP